MPVPTRARASLGKPKRRAIAGQRSPTRHEATGPPQDQSDSDLTRHLLAFSGVLVLVAVATKILRVSHLDLTSALTLASQGSPTTIALGVLLLFFPVIPAFSLIFIWEGLRRRRSQTKEGRAQGSLGYLLLFVGAALMIALMVTAVSAKLVVLALGVPVGYAVAGLLRTSHTWGQAKRARRVLARNVTHRPLGTSSVSIPTTVVDVLIILICLAGIGPIAAVLFNDAVWLPAVQVTMKKPDLGFVGYEITSTDQQMTLLREDDRRVVIIDRKQIISMEPCRLANLANGGQSVLGLVTGARQPSTSVCFPSTKSWSG